MDNVITGISENIFRINNIYDPDQTGTGHQPLSHDQWATLYKNYLVYGAKATATVIASGNSTAIPSTCTIALVLSDVGSSITSIETAVEYPRSQFRKVGPNDGAGAQTMSTGYVDIAAMAGNKGVLFDASQWGAAFGSSPANELFCHLVANADDLSSTRINVMMVIDFYVWVFEPTDLTAS